MTDNLMEQFFAVHNQLVEAADPEVAEALENERRRQKEGLELIASENFVSPAVMAAMGSVNIAPTDRLRPDREIESKDVLGLAPDTALEDARHDPAHHQRFPAATRY